MRESEDIHCMLNSDYRKEYKNVHKTLTSYEFAYILYIEYELGL